MQDFRRVTDNFWVSPQIGQDDVDEAARRGFAMIVNNRPDDEEEGQPTADEMRVMAERNGLAYVAIPVTHAGFSQGQINGLLNALADVQGPVLAFCRSGTRSILLWALAQASKGTDPETLAAAAQTAGYDLSSIRATMDMIAPQDRA